MVRALRLLLSGNGFSSQPRVYRPGIYPNNMKLDSKTASFYQSRPSEHLDGRQAIVPCANILGGGSSINFMVSDALLKFSIQLSQAECVKDVYQSIRVRLRRLSSKRVDDQGTSSIDEEA